MDPIAFKVGGFAIYWYGILVAGGFLAGLWTASRRCVLDKLDGKVISDLGVWIILAGMIGARAMHVVTYWEDQYAGQPLSHLLDFRGGGLRGRGAASGGFRLYRRHKALFRTPAPRAWRPAGNVAVAQGFQ